MIHIVAADAATRSAVELALSKRNFGRETYADGEEFLREARLGGGCILLDRGLRAPGAEAVLAALVRRRVVLPVILIGDAGPAKGALEAGVAGFVAKPLREEDLLAAVDRAEALFRAGESRRAAAAAARSKLERLSRRERQILEGLVEGLPNKAIARGLGLSPRTVEMHRANMMAELGAATLSDALRLALEGGLASAGGEASGGPDPEPAPAGLAQLSRPEARSRPPTRLDLLFRFSRERR